MTAIDAITRFIFVEDAPQPAEICFIPGGPGDENVLRAAALYKEGYFPLLLPSGAHTITRAAYEGVEPSEWAHMQRLLLQSGVPASAILREDQATYTWQNALFSRRITDALGLTVGTAILCCKAHHARRALTYYEMAYPETRFLVCPAPVPGLSRQDWHQTQSGMDAVFGEMQRFSQQMPGMEAFRR